MAQWNTANSAFQAQAKTLFEVNQIATLSGQPVSTSNRFPVDINNAVVSANPSAMAVDAFGRARMSMPLTMFDSSHRYRDNGLWIGKKFLDKKSYK